MSWSVSGVQASEEWLNVEEPRPGAATATPTGTSDQKFQESEESKRTPTGTSDQKFQESEESEESQESKESKRAGDAAGRSDAASSQMPSGSSQQSVADAGSILACRATVSAAALTVDEIVAIALRCDGEALPEFPGIKRGDDPTMNLSWLLVGSDRVTGKYLDHQIFNFEIGGCLKIEAVEVATALRSAPSISPSHRLVLDVLTEFANLIASDPGKLPLGPILGFGAMTGVPMVRHTYADAFGREVAFVLPRDGEKGESALPEIVKTGPPATHLTSLIRSICGSAMRCQTSNECPLRNKHIHTSFLPAAVRQALRA
jgi:hypothetical protein